MSSSRLFRDPSFYCHVLFSVLFISIFICVFFFTYAASIEKKIVVSQTRELVDDLTQGANVFWRHTTTLEDFVNRFDEKSSTAADDRVRQQNKALLKEAALVIGVGASILLIVALWLIRVYELDWKNLVWTNVQILLIVAAVEFFFLTFIAQNFKSFDPNYVKGVIVNKLKEIRQNQPA